MRLTFFLFLTCIAGLSARAGDFSGTSPSGKLGFASKNEKEFYIWATDKPENKVLIYKDGVVFIQSVAISPNDAWIGLEQGGGSLGHTILFFKRDKGLAFRQVGGGNNDPDPAETVGTFALKTKGIKENILDHSYLHPVKWGPKSVWLFVALDAKGKYRGQTVSVTNWRCRYNPVTHEIQPVENNPGKIEIGSKVE